MSGAAPESESLRVLAKALARLDESTGALPPAGTEADALGNDAEAIEQVLLETATRMQDNFPYAHPLYAGQMLKPPHPVARLAYSLAMTVNPNNHALDGGRASSAMEKEAVTAIARMFGWGEFLGHLTGGGTMANLEALYVAAQLHPGDAIAASSQAHYTHGRISGVLGIPFQSVPVDASGRMDLHALEQLLGERRIGTVVATMGTTALGSVDPMAGLLALQRRHGFRIHADAAYGGYFSLACNLESATAESFSSVSQADSIVIDPHKHGLQPYGCGCVLFRDPSVGRFYRHDSPYTYFSSGDLHLGEISLECSRPGAAAVALWATQRLLPLDPGGVFAKGLEDSRRAALALHARLCGDARFIAGPPPELDIVVWGMRASSVGSASALARRVFEAAAEHHLYLALAELPIEFLGATGAEMERDRSTITCLRSVLMKPEHLAWLERIWQRLDVATAGVTTR
ncbi:MAG: aminotransferase class I/II-fold pyridoxal phosphate-dependent enzyme [Candidatus Eisenbacteria bacterium]